MTTPNLHQTDTHPEPTIIRPRKATLLKYVKRIGGIVVVLYLSLCGLIYLAQDWMIFPGRATQGRPEAVVVETVTTSLVKLSLPDGTPVVARFDRATSMTPSAPTVLLFYGNGQCMKTSGGVIFLFQQLGCNVLTLDYPGYGMSGGTASEASLCAAADAAWSHVIHRNDIDTNNLHIVGWSMGGAVAIDLASRVNPRSLTTLSTFTSMSDMARRTAPIVPVSFLLKHRFDSRSKIGRVKCPILMIHGLLDTIVPAEMTRTLASNATAPVTTFFAEKSDHNDIFDVDPVPLVTAIARHIIQSVP